MFTMTALLLLTIIIGDGFFRLCNCDQSPSLTASSMRRTRRTATITPDFITVADIAAYLSGDNHRRIKSIDMLESNDIEKEEKEMEKENTMKWPKVDFLSMPTDSPVIGPGSICNDEGSRSDSILSVLRSVTPEPVLLNTVTPQGMAFAWLVSEDPASSSSLANPCDNIRRILQRYALVVLYYSTSGDSWNDKTGWLEIENECQWAKVTCRSDNQAVLALSLSENNLIGELPAEIKVLEFTEELLMFGNNLKGTLPDGISSMAQLRILDVERNAISGQPLVKLYNLLNLRQIHLSENQFDEQISGVGLANWELVQDLWIGNNLFRGVIPEEIGSMESLESLIIYGNDFTGSIPSSIGSNRIKTLIAHENMLDGTIPESLFNNIDMTRLRLDSNNFSGNLSSSIGDLKSLLELRLGRNKFTGSLPSTLWELKNLQLLSISNNNFSGTLLDSFSEFNNLEAIDVGQNLLNGTLPSTLFTIPKLRLVYFSNNRFSGNIPANFGNSSVLRDLYLNNNELEGLIPPIIQGQLPLLNELLLQKNSLTGTMPESICALTDSNLGTLEDLWSDCELVDGVAQVTCSCCTQCVFETGSLA